MLKLNRNKKNNNGLNNCKNYSIRLFKKMNVLRFNKMMNYSLLSKLIHLLRILKIKQKSE